MHLKPHLVLLCLLLFSSANVLSAKDSTPPNIVVFLSDDHTWRDCQLYGDSDIETPNMKRIAANGLVFNNAFVASPSCAPSRAAMLTGLYPANNGAQPNHSRPGKDIKKLPAYLQELGYEVVAFGKVGHYRQTTEYGFDIARHFNYHEDVAVPNAIKWLEQRDDDRPLCLFVGTNWPHVPWPKQTSFDPNTIRIPPNHVDTDITRQWRVRYAEAVKVMDREMGQVYDSAKNKFGENFVFLHTSDHGAQWPFGKWNLYDDGIRTPMLACWPGKIEPGTRTNAMVSWIDILPTLVEVAGGIGDEKLDGRSFLPVLTGETDTHRDAIFTTHSGDGRFNVYPSRSVRLPNGWKYIRNLHPEYRFTSHVTHDRPDSRYWDAWIKKAATDPAARNKVIKYQRRPAEELYQTNDDPYEQKNLVDDPQRANILASLRKQLNQWMHDTDDKQFVFGQGRPFDTKGKPNIICVFIDDMGWSDLSCFGGTETTTENIDRLAKEGLHFTNFYVNSPICSPSRVALLTGQYPHRWNITSFLSNRRSNRNRGMKQWLDVNAPSLAREFRAAGYATGHFGKWHMGGQRDVGNAPQIDKYGFDESLTNFEGLGPRVLPLLDSYDGSEPRRYHLGSANLGKGPIKWADRSQVTTEFVDEAMRFIKRAKVSDQAFYINVWPDDVHSPFFPPENLRKGTNGAKRELYYAVLDSMDQQLGRLFDMVKNDEQLKNNTLILVMSDNGHEQGAGKSDPLRGSKTWLYEGGIRSPLIVWGPGLVDEAWVGQPNEKSVLCALDINRSLYSIAGVRLPEGHQLDGEDMSSTLLGQEQDSRHQPICWRRPPDRPGNEREDNPDLAIREGKWKYLVNYDGGNPQLYDLSKDIDESENLVDDFPDIAKQLNQKLMAWNKSMPKDAGDPDWTSLSDQ